MYNRFCLLHYLRCLYRCDTNFVIPDEKQHIIDAATEEVKEIENQYASGLVTQGEEVTTGESSLWHKANERRSPSAMNGQPEVHPRLLDRDGKEVEQESFTP